MSLTSFYREQADQQQRAAQGSALRNVRERCQRASSAWSELADRSERNDTARGQAAANKQTNKASH